VEVQLSKKTDDPWWATPLLVIVIAGIVVVAGCVGAIVGSYVTLAVFIVAGWQWQGIGVTISHWVACVGAVTAIVLVILALLGTFTSSLVDDNRSSQE
jgi:uncharacterized membrane protein